MALQRLGGHCLGFSEIAKDAINTYCQNYKETETSNLGDITKLQSLPRHNLLTGGVPCQSWSIAGKNLGFDDARGQLWNDALFLLKKSQPDAFIFENVKGLADPRNRAALTYILDSIRSAGYFAQCYLLNAYDYGVPQNRIRIYIIGFKEEKYFKRFSLPDKHTCNATLSAILSGNLTSDAHLSNRAGRQSISANENGLNDYFLFNDLRNGDTTIHSWDLTETTEWEKQICLLLLQNRRKKKYGKLDGNPLSLKHFQELNVDISQSDLNALVEKGILKKEDYLFSIKPVIKTLDTAWAKILSGMQIDKISIDDMKGSRDFKIAKISVCELVSKLVEDGLAECVESRYDFKNTKISTGLNGINRIFLPSSRIYPTLVASDTNDYITDVAVEGNSPKEYKKNFLEKVFKTNDYRRISKEEACAIQGFPSDFVLPSARNRWMKLIGNSVAVPMVQQLAEKIIATGVFNEADVVASEPAKHEQLSLFADEGLG